MKINLIKNLFNLRNILFLLLFIFRKLIKYLALAGRRKFILLLI